MIIKNKKEVRIVYKGDKISFCMLKGENMIYGARNPYNSETTRILMTNFPQKFVEICRYGNIHTQIVPFINEDPMLVCSLGIEGMPIRWLKGNASCWIDTGVGTDVRTPLDTTFIFTELNNNNCGIMSNGTFEIYYWGKTIEFHCSSNFNLISNAQTNEKYRLKVENGVYTFWRNDVQAGTGNRNLGTQSRKVALFALNRGSASYQTKAMIAECKIGSKHFIPFLHKDGDNEIPCMLDLAAVGVTGAQTIYEKYGGSGSFTIEYTLQDGVTQWKPYT